MGREEGPGQNKTCLLGTSRGDTECRKASRKLLFNPEFSPVSCLGLKLEVLVVVGAAEVGLTDSIYCPVGIGAGKAC